MSGLSFHLSRYERATSMNNTASMCQAFVKCRSHDIKRLKKITSERMCCSLARLGTSRSKCMENPPCVCTLRASNRTSHSYIAVILGDLLWLKIVIPFCF